IRGGTAGASALLGEHQAAAAALEPAQPTQETHADEVNAKSVTGNDHGRDAENRDVADLHPRQRDRGSGNDAVCGGYRPGEAVCRKADADLARRLLGEGDGGGAGVDEGLDLEAVDNGKRDEMAARIGVDGDAARTGRRAPLRAAIDICRTPG